MVIYLSKYYCKFVLNIIGIEEQYSYFIFVDAEFLLIIKVCNSSKQYIVSYWYIIIQRKLKYTYLS